VSGVQLKKFGLDERGFQDILFRSLDRLIGDDELLLLMQSRHWQEEPDLMALDREGRLYIFEIKVWEAHQENLLQVLRYGQINGASDYDELERIWRRTAGSEKLLSDAHEAKFDVKLRREDYNNTQVFVVLTNGLDVDTRQAIRYWRKTKLDVRPWVYRAYELDGQLLIEISSFRTADDPLEDQAETEGDGYYILNTNIRNDAQDDEAMLAKKKAAAYFEPWKFKIARLKKGDHVFLYRSGVGIVAAGKATGKLKKASYHGQPEHKDEEYSMALNDFVQVRPPLTAAEVKEISGNSGLVFRQTMFSLDREAGAKLYQAVSDRIYAS
jgi:ribosomal protein L39E